MAERAPKRLIVTIASHVRLLLTACCADASCDQQRFMPDLPVDIWAYIMDILEDQRGRAATIIQADVRGHMLRKGPLGCVRFYVRKPKPRGTATWRYHAQRASWLFHIRRAPLANA